MRTFLLGAFIFLLSSKTQAQMQDLAWSTYDTASKISVVKFSVLTKLETELAKGFEGFKDNRARLTLTDSGNRISPKELQKPDFPVLCQCKLKEDTIFITTALGFMSGLGIITTITRDRFITNFFQEADNTNVFKSKKSDTSYVDRISISTVSQKLTLLKKPFFTDNENILGVLEGQFKTFYEFDLGAEVARNYRAKLFFKCRSKQQ